MSYRRPLGALTPSQEATLWDRVSAIDEQVNAGIALLDTANARGANAGELQRATDAYYALSERVLTALSYINADADRAVAETMLAELERDWPPVKSQLEQLAGVSHTGKLLVWGALAVLGAGTLAYVVYRYRSRKRA